MKITSLSVSFMLAIIVGLGVGCAKKADDAKISSEIQNKFSQDSGLSSKRLTVQVDAGVVTLAGSVDNDAQREAAARQAASVPGAKTVINNLQVGNATAASAAEPATSNPVVRTEAAEKPRTSGGRKGRKANASEDSGSASNSGDNSNPN